MLGLTNTSCIAGALGRLMLVMRVAAVALPTQAGFLRRLMLVMLARTVALPVLGRLLCDACCSNDPTNALGRLVLVMLGGVAALSIEAGWLGRLMLVMLAGRVGLPITGAADARDARRSNIAREFDSGCWRERRPYQWKLGRLGG